MKVSVISCTENPEQVIAAAARLCYSMCEAAQVMEDTGSGECSEFIKKLIKMNHLSPFEHASITFAVDGMSRVTSHQLVRHRIASYSQKSQRYVAEGSLKYVVPDSVRKDARTIAYYTYMMEQLYKYYRELIRLGVPKEDARYILPNATKTNIILTMNFRTLLHFFSLRCCNRAQWEIREMADKMLIECKKIAPNVFENAGPSCIVEGVCNEGNMTCGNPRRSIDWEI